MFDFQQKQTASPVTMPLRRPGTMVGGKGNKAGQNDPCSRPFGRLGENPAPNLIEFHGSTPAHFEHR
jgi:hypothetical protein